MINHNVKQVRIKLAHENHQREKLTWSGMFLHTPTKADIIAALKAQVQQVVELHIAQHDGDTQADPGGLKLKVGQIECFEQVVAFWDGVFPDFPEGKQTPIWLNGYIKLAEIEIKDMIPLWINEAPNE